MAHAKALRVRDAQRQPLVNFIPRINVGVLIGFIGGKVALAKLGKAGNWQTHHFTDLLSARITACNYSEQLLVTADENGQIQCWNTERLILVKRAQTQFGRIHHMFYENDTLLVVDCVLDDDLGKRPYNNASLKFFSMPNMLPTGGGAMHRSWGLWAHCKFLTEQRVILVDAFVTVIQDFGVEGHPVTEYTSPSKYRNMYVAVSPPSPVRLFAVSSDCGTICIYKTADTKPVVICKGNGKSAHGLNWLAYNQSAMAMSMTILAVVCWYGSVLIFDIMTGEQLHASCPPISRPLPEHFSEMGALVDEHGWWPRVRNIFLHPYRPRGLIDHHYAATAFNLEFCWDYDELLPVYDPFGHLSGWKRRFW